MSRAGVRQRLTPTLLVMWIGFPALAAEPGIALRGGQVHTMSGAGVVDPAVVLVRGHRIEAVGAGLAIPDGYEVVDVSGRIVTPGLIDSGSQVGLVEISGEATTVDGRVSEYPSGASFDVQYALNPESVVVGVNRAAGVTRAVVAPTSGNDPFAGWGAAVRLGGGAFLTSPRIGLFGAIDTDSAGFVGGSRGAVIQRMRRGLTLASGYNPARYQPGPGDFSHQDLAALKAYLGGRAPLVLTVHRAAEIRQAVELARNFDRNLILMGGTEAWEVAGLLAEQRIPVVVDVLANLPASFERRAARLDNAALLHEAGVPVLLRGTGTHDMRLIRQNAGNAVANGLPWEAALAAITREPARVWGLGEGVGTLQAGAPADLVVWSGDPLEVTTWAERVMIDGAWQDTSSRQTRLFERYRNLSDEDFQYR
jgi:imidazolonepropionase-like amidohydrolase